MSVSGVEEFEIRRELVRGTCTWLLVRSAGEEFVVQAVTAELMPRAKRLLRAQNEKIERIGSGSVLASSQVIEAPGYSYVLRYDKSIADELTSIFETAVRSDPDSVIPIAQGALSVLGEVHRSGATVGVFTPRSILWKDGRVKLYSFLYDSLVREDVDNIRKAGAGLLPPELRYPRTEDPTPASDLWSLAHLLAGEKLGNSALIRNSAWYRACHADDPAARPQSVEAAMQLFASEFLGAPAVPGVRPPAAPAETPVPTDPFGQPYSDPPPGRRDPTGPSPAPIPVAVPAPVPDPTPAPIPVRIPATEYEDFDESVLVEGEDDPPPQPKLDDWGQEVQEDEEQEDAAQKTRGKVISERKRMLSKERGITVLVGLLMVLGLSGIFALAFFMFATLVK